MTTSGAPLPAETAVWNLLYSSPPWPTLVQQTCTSLWPLLKLSTTLAMLGYHAQTVTTGADFTTILFVQFLATEEPPPEPPPLHAARAMAIATAETAAIRAFFFTVTHPFRGALDFV